MLEKLGFKYNGFIDPFDGGPHLESPTGDISLVKATRDATLGDAIARSACDSFAIVSALDADGEFRATQTVCKIGRSRISLPRDVIRALDLEPGRQIGLTPIPKAAAKKRRRRAQS
jgi:arginine N-succinyltransferase